jgi:hypothetical protein
MKCLGNENGQALILAAVGLSILLGFAAFATDLGVVMREKRIAQTAADSAAIAGASALQSGGDGTSAIAAGRADAKLNGFNNGSDGAVVTINTPVTDDSNAAFNNTGGYVEAIVSAPTSTPLINTFLHLFNPSSTYTGMTVAARSVARLGAAKGCIYTLGATGIDIDGSGGETLIDPSCGIIDDSSSSDALTLSGGAQVNVQSIGIVGGVAESGSASTDASVVTTGITYMSDPLAYLNSEAPSFSTSTCANPQINVSGNGTTVNVTAANDACYQGINVSGGATLNITNGGTMVIAGNISISGSSTVNFGPGVYYFTGQFSASGGDTANGTQGVTFFAAGPSGSYDISGGANLDLIAPTSGAYSGILFWQALGDTSTITISGGADSTLEGVIYAPNGTLNLSGGTGTNFYTDVVVDSMNLSGSASLYNYSKLSSASDPIQALELVE